MLGKIAPFLGTAGLATIGWSITIFLDNASPDPWWVGEALLGTGLIFIVITLVLFLLSPIRKLFHSRPPLTNVVETFEGERAALLRIQSRSESDEEKKRIDQQLNHVDEQEARWNALRRQEYYSPKIRERMSS